MRKIIAFCLIIGLSIGVMTLDAEEAGFKKNVSVVFDDSGSMAFDVRWAHANYALQTLVSLLDEGDLLHIHYMNRTQDDLDLVIKKGQELNQLLETIRTSSIPDVQGAGETPIDSIRVGLDNLEKSEQLQQSGVTYDNWLILITDGNEMTDTQGTKLANYVTDTGFDSGYKWVGILDRAIVEILKDTEVKYSTVIMKIDDSKQDMLITSDMINGPLIYKSAQVGDEFLEDKQIIQNMNDIATLISGRLEVTTKEQKKNEVVIESNVPFYTLDLLLQDSRSEVTGILDAEGNPIDIKIDNIPLKSPDSIIIGSKNLVSDTNLYGSEIRLTYTGEEALKSGAYTIVFGESVESAKVTGFCYPAIQFIFDYYVNGQKVEKVFQEDRVSLEFIPVRSGTKEVIEKLPDNIQFSIDLRCGNQFISFDGNSLHTNEFSIRSSTIEGSLTAQIPDVWLWSLNILEQIDIAPEEEKPVPREFTLEVSPAETIASYKDFKNAPFVALIPKLNGERLSEDEIANGSMSIVRIYNENEVLVNLETTLEQVGDHYQFKPIYHGFKPNLPSGKYKIEVKYTNIGNSGEPLLAFNELYYTIGDAPFVVRYFSYIVSVIGAALLLIYLVGFMIKPRIDYKHYHIVKSYYDSMLDLDEPVTEELIPIKVRLISRILKPYQKEIGKAGELTLKAGSKTTHIYIVKESQKENMSIDAFVLKGELVGKRDLRLNTEQKLEYIVDGKLITYQYQKIRTK